MKAFDRTFNQVVLAMAPDFRVSAFAPTTYRELMCQDGLTVWDGASDCTIYADPHVNHAFRAWHDATHIAHGYDFTLEDECKTAKAQCRDLLARYPCAPRLWFNLIRAEVIGQAEHFARYSMFPVDQIAFMKGYLNGTP